MLDWLGFIGEFVAHYFQMAWNVAIMFFDSIILIDSTFAFAPLFIEPIMICMLAAITIMWVVNIF